MTLKILTLCRFKPCWVRFVGSHVQCVSVCSASPWKLQAIWMCSSLLQGCCHIQGDGKPGAGSAGDMRVAIFTAQVSKQIFLLFFFQAAY